MDALGLPGSVVPLWARNGMPCVMSDLILEAEMVAFSDATGGIDGNCTLVSRVTLMLSFSLEFWRIRSLVESTAVGPRHKVRKAQEQTLMM